MLAKSSRGIDVTELQKNLTTLGYIPGSIDGFYGSKVEEAVMKFQGKNGLKVDGIVGPKTESKIKEVVKKLNDFKGIERELQGFSLVVDPGHGGDDPGAVDGKNDDSIYTEEEDINLAVGLKLQTKLAAKGARVTITRGKDTYPTLQQRCDMANKFKADIFISLHCNAGPSAAAGIETLVNPASVKGKVLAQLVQDELIKATGAFNRGVKYRDNLYVLNGTKMPAILIEMGFITNPGEESKLNNPSFQDKIVDAIVKGIINYRKA